MLLRLIYSFVMQQRNHNIDFNRLHDKVLYAVEDDERKDAVSIIFYVSWIVSGLIILFLALSHGGEAAMMAFMAAGIAGGILWLVNTRWKRKLHMKYTADNQ